MKLALILSATLALGLWTSRPLPADETPQPSTVSVIPAEKTPSQKPAPPSDDVRPKDVRAFPLRYVQADMAATMLKQLGADVNFAVDVRTNSLIGHDSSENLDKLKAVIEVIDRPGKDGATFVPANKPAATAPAEQSRPSNTMTIPFGDASLPTAGDLVVPSIGHTTPENIRRLRLQYRQSEGSASMMAKNYRQLRQHLDPTEKAETQRLERLKVELQSAVTTAYRVREELQVAEIDWLRQRLARIEGQLKERESLKQQIIDRRVEALLNPGLQWTEAPGATSVTSDRGSARPEDEIASREKEHDTRNNLKLLALAMHNFHDSFSHFPKAVSTARDFGRKTDTPHSWRIDLLPFLGAANLYEQYNMDEPWDGPHNKKLLSSMPAVFRSPYDAPNSTNSSYYVLVGNGTVFEPAKEGIKISDITDGTSNTILLVEQKRATPWTKPEDIPFDAAGPTPKLGGFVGGKFAAVMADGRTAVFKHSKVDDILKWLIIRNDGNVIQIPFEE
jgi:uncharacterized protein DUF1559/type II/III secretion system protein